MYLFFLGVSVLTGLISLVTRSHITVQYIFGVICVLSAIIALIVIGNPHYQCSEIGNLNKK